MFYVYKHRFDLPDQPDRSVSRRNEEGFAYTDAGHEAAIFATNNDPDHHLFQPRYQVYRGAYYAKSQQRPAWYVLDTDPWVKNTDKDRIAVFYVVEE